ncbi:MAG: hypothetical protein UT33_C0009G0032 [Candidatus Peregrinibacteria bacterium GW2011_GWC2_39_14]|nr:MAG: hypothetical protein US92_C0005G0032 [Candidatus Peregrinibacteria bacterium GW2011_GWA2_38_36]KKR06581.1 MAG: hypothetical protein UT33_C0009G0032 [Candidatus Peregrinibacteria bacterium GW2011_GWC2_39_14]
MNMTNKIIAIISTIVVPVLVAFISPIYPSSSTNISTTGNQSPAIQADSVQINYEGIKDPNIINNRTEELKGINPEELTGKYYGLLNNNRFREVCSLMAKSKCDINDGSEVQELQREVFKHISGYEDIKVWDPEALNKSKIICSKYSYTLKADSNPQRIWEIISFYFDRREDGEWEITSRTCEKKYKDGLGERACPQPASQKYCIKN